VSDHPPVPAPISTAAEAPRKLELVTEPHRPEPTVQSPRVEAPRIVVAMDPHPPEPPEPALSFARVEHRIERPAPGPALALEGELDLRGKSKLRALASSPLAIIAVVLIVLIIVAGKVLIAWHDSAQREDPRRPASGRCTERIERIERTERTCERDGS
jgi:hypothetical protein